jgi:hypothetical protein
LADTKENVRLKRIGARVNDRIAIEIVKIFCLVREQRAVENVDEEK